MERIVIKPTRQVKRHICRTIIDTEEKTCAKSRCCENESQVDDRRPETGGRLTRRRWQSSIVPLVTVISFLLLGYCLDAEVIKLLSPKELYD